MVKLIESMNSTNLQVIPAPPSLMKSLMAGFDAISKHFELVIFTVCLDLFLWLGPRLSVAGLFESALNQPLVLPESADPEMLVRFRELVGEFNLFIVLRTLPIGIPSLMVSRSPVASPLGEPILLEVPSLGMAFVVWLILIIVGASAGAFYFAGVAQAALVSDVSWQIVIARWPWTSLQTWFLMAFWIFLIFSASMLFGCALTILFLVSGLALEQVALFALLIFSGVVIWALIPLLFSPHGLFVARNTMWTSIKKSANLTARNTTNHSFVIHNNSHHQRGSEIVVECPAVNFLVGHGRHCRTCVYNNELIGS